jgi:predicted nucleic acid-binding protein
MITALDSSVLLDVIFNDTQFATASLTAISRARSQGQLIVCEAVVVEIMPTLPGRGVFDRFMTDLGADFVPISEPASRIAGDYFAKYLKSGGKRGRVAADFLIGGHAKYHADQLLTRNDGFYRKLFRGLKVITP